LQGREGSSQGTLFLGFILLLGLLGNSAAILIGHFAQSCMRSAILVVEHPASCSILFYLSMFA
jgi:hypothetical protein